MCVCVHARVCVCACARNNMIYYAEDFIIARKVSCIISLLVCTEISYKNVSKNLRFAFQAVSLVLKHVIVSLIYTYLYVVTAQ